MSVYKGYTITELETEIMTELGQVSGTTVSWNMFSRAWLRKKLSNRQNQFVEKARCLKKFAIIRAKDGVRQYPLPSNCLENNGVLNAKFYSSETAYENLRVVDQEYMDSIEDGYREGSEGDPDIAWQGDTMGNIPTLNVHQVPDTDGTAYRSNLDTGVAIGTDLPDVMNNVTGTATGGSGTTLVHTDVGFSTMGLVVGMYVRNRTDGSYGSISAVTDADTLTFAEFTGGTDDEFASSDKYTILSGEYGVLVDWDQNEEYIFGYYPGFLANLTIPANNFVVEYVPYPIEFPTSGSAGAYPEIPKRGHHGLAMGVVADFLSSFHENTKQFKRAEAYEQKFQAAVAECTTSRTSRPFDTKPVQIRPRKR